MICVSRSIDRFTCIYIYVFTYVYVCMYVCMYVSIYIYTYMHTYGAKAFSGVPVLQTARRRLPLGSSV